MGWTNMYLCWKQCFFTFFSFQLKNAFDNLFEGLMESKDGEKEAAVVGT